MSYDADDNVLARTTRAGGTISFAYDTMNRICTKTIATSPTACTATSSAAPTVWFGHDLAGHVTSAIDNSAAIAAAVPPAPGTPASYVTAYAYDKLNRPTNVNWSPAPTFTAPAAGSVTFAHAYNGVNQRVSQAVNDNSWLFYPAATASNVSYTTNALNQYTAVGAAAPSYDGNGNLTSDGTFTFGYDAESRLTAASGAGNTATYVYSAQGRRKTKTVNGITTVFVSDADNREVLEYDGTSGAILRWYAYGLGSNDVLNQTNVAAATRAAFIPDIQGSVIASIDSSSGTLSKIGYLPYGKSANASTPFGYTAQRIDPETGGLYYYRARHYSPAWGRLLQSDPIGYAGGVNLYAYVNNDPLNLIDPHGLFLDNAVDLSTGVSAAQTRQAISAAGTLLQPAAQAAADPGSWASIQGLGPPGMIAGRIGGLFAKGVQSFGAAEETAAAAGGGLTRVGRWMSQGEFDAMSETGLVQGERVDAHT